MTEEGLTSFLRRNGPTWLINTAVKLHHFLVGNVRLCFRPQFDADSSLSDASTPRKIKWTEATFIASRAFTRFTELYGEDQALTYSPLVT
jgi:hypothetical protein